MIRHSQTFIVFILSLFAIPVCYFLSTVKELYDENVLFVIAVGLCVGIVLISMGLFGRRDLYVIGFSFFTWTCLVDLLLAFNIDGFIDWLDFYLEEGEKYLQSAHGAAINYWDGSVHYVLYLIMIDRLSAQSARPVSLISFFWFGSIINSLLVFLPGNALGPFAVELKPSFLLNVPYVFLPIFYALRTWKRQQASHANVVEKQEVIAPRQSNRLIHWLLAIMFMIGIGLATIRLLIVLDTPIELLQAFRRNFEPLLAEPSTYPKMQMLCDFFYRLPMMGMFVYELISTSAGSFDYKRHKSLENWAWIHAGAVCQGYFTYAFCAFHHLTPVQYRAEAGDLKMFVAIQAIVVIPSLVFPIWLNLQRQTSKTTTKKDQKND